ncbi:hypothetical protein ACSDQ9_00375 [Aestuariimicrobium soli]|uniref:hypothetical protein n=1 Tax=Aestuariimicrobium soli TaxID=2035834 RepID=UPI003EBB387C
MNRVEFERWVSATRPSAEAAVAALLGLPQDDLRVQAITDEAFARIWACRWRLGDDADPALRRMVVRLCRPGEVTLEAADRPSNTAQWRERATRSRSPIPAAPGQVKRRTVIAAAAAVPVAAGAAAGLWRWTTRQPPPQRPSAIRGDAFTVQLTLDRGTGVTRVARPATSGGVVTPLAALPQVPRESLHAATVVLPPVPRAGAGASSRRSRSLLLVHHPELVWADLHGDGVEPFTLDQTQTYAAAEPGVLGGGSSSVVWGDLAGRVHGPSDVLGAPFPGRKDWLIYVRGGTSVVRTSRRGVAQPGQNSHLLVSLPLDVDAELPLIVHELHLADGSVVVGVVWSVVPQENRGEERVEWDLGDVPVSAPTEGGARFWHLPGVRDTFPDLTLDVDGTRRRFTIYR